MIAEVTFVPPDQKQYAIQESKGSGLGEKIVRRMLAGEADITKDYRSTDFSPGNYDFRFVREEDVEGQRCYVLELLPKRKDRNLVRGNIWVDAHTYLLHRTEGEPAKKPSWWLRDVRMVFLYGDVGGMWLQISSEATADCPDSWPTHNGHARHEIQDRRTRCRRTPPSFCSPTDLLGTGFASSKFVEVIRSRGGTRMELDKTFKFR